MVLVPALPVRKVATWALAFGLGQKAMALEEPSFEAQIHLASAWGGLGVVVAVATIAGSCCLQRYPEDQVLAA